MSESENVFRKTPVNQGLRHRRGSDTRLGSSPGANLGQELIFEKENLNQSRNRIPEMGNPEVLDEVIKVENEGVSNFDDSEAYDKKKKYNLSPGFISESRSVNIGNGSAENVRLLHSDESDEDESYEDEDVEVVKVRDIKHSETFWSVTIQIFFPFLIAGIGMVGAGLILDVVQHWAVFIQLPEVFILVPALLGLKGNLEMTLASRLSTQANLGNMDLPNAKWNLAIGNLSLVQCQAIVVGFLASVAAVILGWIPQGKFDLNHFLILCSSSVATASLASLVLSTIMVGIIILSRSLKVNPDNVATPIAASLGDLTTLSVLACISNTMFKCIDSHAWLAPLILVTYFMSMPIWIYLAKENASTRKVLFDGWTPVLIAMVISSFGGLILDFTVKTFNGIAVFQPVISGVGGNLVAVQASRLSTSLHQHARLGELPESITPVCTNPISVFFSHEIQSVTARALVLMTVPGHLVFILFLQAGHGHTSFTPVFFLSYLLASLIQVVILLYIADILVKVLWKNKVDPDNSAIPYLTALGDLIGTSLLALAFLVLFWIGDRDTDVGD